MASKTSLPIARLRSLGCRVTTTIGHDPAVGDWIYSVTLPSQPGLSVESSQTELGVATARIVSAGRRLRVEACLYRPGQPIADPTRRAEAERDIAGLLNKIADTLSKAGA